MKASDLINKLTELINEYGDLDVLIPKGDAEYSGNIGCVEYSDWFEKLYIS